MIYPIKTIDQLRPILQGFRKAAGMTQTAVAAQLGVTQQTYAQLEANPAAVSVERLLKVLRVLGAEMTFTSGETAPFVYAEEAGATYTVPARTKKKTAKATSSRTATRRAPSQKQPEKQPEKKAEKKRENW